MGATSPSPCSQTQTLSYSVSAGTTIGSIQILTSGSEGLDFRAEASDTSTTLCKAQSYSSAATCTVDVTFAPAFPGMHKGAVEFLDGSRNVLATTYIYGTGTGPVITLAPVAQYGGFGPYTPAYGVAVDDIGNVYVADAGPGGSITEGLGGSEFPEVRSLGSGFNNPTSVAVDGAGNVFVADYGNYAVKEIVAASRYTVVKTLESTTIHPQQLAVDGAGNVFVAYSVKNNPIREMLAASGYKKIDTLPIDNPYPNAIAIDGDDNIFVASNTLFEEVLAAGGYTTVNILNQPGEPLSIALDASDNVYVALAGTYIGPIYEYEAADGYKTINTFGSFRAPQGLGLDSRGNIYVLDIDEVSVIDRSQTTLAYTAAPPGSISSPQSVTVQNVGNAPLEATGAGLTISSDWDFVAGSGTPPDCTTTFSLQPGTDCNISISYEPSTSGRESGRAIVTDNTLNAAAPNYAEQMISLYSYLPPLAQVSPSKLAFGSIAYGAKQVMSITIENVGDYFLTVTPSAVNGPSFYVSDNNCPAAGLASEYTCELQITYKPFRVGAHADYFRIATNGANNPTIHLTGSATGVGPILETTLEFGTLKLHTTKTLPLKIYNYGVPGSPTVSAHINGPSFKVLPGSSCSTVGVTAGNSCTLQIQYAPVSVETHDDHITVTPSSGPPTVVQLSGTGVPAN